FFSLGYTTHDRHFLAKLVESGLDVHFCQLEQSKIRLESRSVPDGVRLVDWPGVGSGMSGPAWLRPLAAEFAQVLNRIHPGLVHAGPVPTCGYLAALSGFHPLVVMSWGSDVLVDGSRNAEYEAATRFTLRSADAFVCDSSAVRAKAQEFAELPDDRIV